MCTDNKYQFTDFWANYNEDYLYFSMSEMKLLV